MVTSLFYCSHANFLSSLSTFNNDCLQKILTDLGMLYPYTDARLLQTYFTELSMRGVITQRKSVSGKSKCIIANLLQANPNGLDIQDLF